MSHVVVGERLAGLNPEMVGHVIRGAGHFIANADGLIQQFAQNMQAIPLLAQNVINDLSTPIGAERWQWQQLNTHYGTNLILAGSNHESSAWDRFMDHPSMRNNVEVLREAAIAAGGFLSGDMETAIGYGASAAEKGVDGFLRDWGFNGGWGDHGSLMGTLQPTGAGRDH